MAYGLERSRFVALQLYRYLASGSPEQLLICHLLRVYLTQGNEAVREHVGLTLMCQVIPGSRMLPTGRDAILQSGSPPGDGSPTANRQPPNLRRMEPAVDGQS
jgi:hypothetical protein